MTTRLNRRWLIAKPLVGEVSEANFQWSESPVPAIDEGRFLVHNRWLSVDPTQALQEHPCDRLLGHASYDAAHLPATSALGRLNTAKH